MSDVTLPHRPQGGYWGSWRVWSEEIVEPMVMKCLVYREGFGFLLLTGVPPQMLGKVQARMMRYDDIKLILKSVSGWMKTETIKDGTNLTTFVYKT